MLMVRQIWNKISDTIETVATILYTSLSTNSYMAVKAATPKIRIDTKQLSLLSSFCWNSASEDIFQMRRNNIKYAKCVCSNW